MSLRPLEQVDIGALRNRVRIQQLPRDERSDSGAAVIEWTDFATVSAEIETLSGRELAAAREIYPEVSATITIRYLAKIDTTMRVLWADPRTNEDRQFDIVAIDDVLRRHYLMQLTCIERPITRPA